MARSSRARNPMKPSFALPLACLLAALMPAAAMPAELSPTEERIAAAVKERSAAIRIRVFMAAYGIRAGHRGSTRAADGKIVEPDGAGEKDRRAFRSGGFELKELAAAIGRNFEGEGKAL